MASSTRRQPFVVAIDAGGTHTRVGCFACTGELLGKSVGRGGSPDHNEDASENVSLAVVEAFDGAGLRPENAVALAAGVAGLNRADSNQGSGDRGWIDGFLDVPGLTCPRVIVNDAVVAHRGALAGGAGIIAVAGTGSMILAITEDGEEIESGQLQHYAGGARHLVFRVVELILTERRTPVDDPVVAAVLQHWEAHDLRDLRRRLLSAAGAGRNEVKRHFGALAPTVTALAEESPIADRAIRGLAHRTAQGIRLLAPMIGLPVTPVSLAGAVATDSSFRARLRDELYDDPSVQLTRSALDPLGGAALIAYRCAGVPVNDRVLNQVAAREQ